MSAFGRNYFHTDEPEVLAFIANAAQTALEQGTGLRLSTESKYLRLKVGGGSWTWPFESTEDYARDE